MRHRIADLLAQPCEELSPRVHVLIEDTLTRWQAFDERIAAFDAEFVAEAKQNEAARRLTSIPGIGPLNATALVAAVGDALTRGRAARAALPTLSRGNTRLGQWLPVFSRELIPTLLSLHSPPRWRASSGRCFGMAQRLTREQSLPDYEIGRLHTLAGL